MKEGGQRESKIEVEKEGHYVWQMDIALSHQWRREMRTCTTGLTLKAGWCPVRDGPSDSRHIPSHSRDTLRELTGWRAGNCFNWSLNCSLCADYMKVQVQYPCNAMSWTIVPCSVTCCWLLFSWPRRKRVTTKVHLSLVWLMLAIQITPNASRFHV